MKTSTSSSQTTKSPESKESSADTTRKLELSRNLKTKTEYIVRFAGNGNVASHVEQTFSLAKRKLGETPGTIIRIKTIIQKVYEKKRRK